MSETTRRGFLRQVAIGHESAVLDSGERTLVCVFLRGGADTLNLIVPYGDDRYYKLRPTISIPQPNGNDEAKEAAIRLDDFYALHPKLRPLLPLFKEGRLGVVQGIGSDNTSGSHFEAQDQMEHGESISQEGGRSVGGGWLGRHLRSRAGKKMTPLSAIAIGPTIPESLRGAPSSSALRSLDEIQIKTSSGDARAVSKALASMYGAEVGLLAAPGRATLDLLDRVEALRGKPYSPENNAVYPEDDFGGGLREIARLVKARVGLEAACVDLGGWDTHFFQGSTGGLQAEQIDLLAKGLSAFDADLKQERDRVTVIVMTEFGRRVYENGSLGTDHGRGFAMIAIGTRVNGGKIHGAKPDLSAPDLGAPGLSLNADELLGPDGLKITCDYRSVLAETLAGAMGNQNIEKIFPGFKAQPVGLIRGGS
ncbi:MAG: DUF1501 domain-containing protein [Blastocatellales bacterium]